MAGLKTISFDKKKKITYKILLEIDHNLFKFETELIHKNLANNKSSFLLNKENPNRECIMYNIAKQEGVFEKLDFSRPSWAKETKKIKMAMEKKTEAEAAIKDPLIFINSTFNFNPIYWSKKLVTNEVLEGMQKKGYYWKPVFRHNEEQYQFTMSKKTKRIKGEK